MTKYLINLLHWAESTAESVISTKDALLGTLADKIIPLPKTRIKLRQKFKKLLRPISAPLSDKVDQWIETDIFTVANFLSFSRALAGPLFIVFKANSLSNIYLIVLLVWAGFSDYFDGILARKMNQQSELGGGIDAGCDKVFAVCAAISYWNLLWFWPVLIFVIIDGTLFLLAISLYRAKKRGSYSGQAEVKANWLGKVKFNLQAVTLILLLLNLPAEANYALSTANFFALGSLIRHLNPK